MLRAAGFKALPNRGKLKVDSVQVALQFGLGRQEEEAKT